MRLGLFPASPAPKKIFGSWRLNLETVLPLPPGGLLYRWNLGTASGKVTNLSCPCFGGNRSQLRAENACHGLWPSEPHAPLPGPLEGKRPLESKERTVSPPPPGRAVRPLTLVTATVGRKLAVGPGTEAGFLNELFHSNPIFALPGRKRHLHFMNEEPKGLWGLGTFPRSHKS